MKKIYKILTISAALFAAPALSFAQSSDNDPHPLTRAQVKQQAAEVFAAGYNPNESLSYPENLMAAQRRVALQHAGQATQ